MGGTCSFGEDVGAGEAQGFGALCFEKDGFVIVLNLLL